MAYTKHISALLELSGKVWDAHEICDPDCEKCPPPSVIQTVREVSTDYVWSKVNK